MNGKQFFERLPKEFTFKERNKIEQAYWIAKKAHGGQKRDGGGRYFNHPRTVALYTQHYISLLESEDTLMTSQDFQTALLHDVTEDTFPPERTICDLFGESVEKRVLGLSRKIPIYDNTSGYIIRMRKIPFTQYLRNLANKASVKDCVIKMCDRLHNLRTMSRVWTKKEQLEYIVEAKLMLKVFGRFDDTAIYCDLEKEVIKAIRRLIF